MKISKREIAKRYNSMMKLVEGKEIQSQRINCYTCNSCKHVTKTIDMAVGTTPFMHTCEECGDFAHSSMYNDISPNKKPTQTWYRPSLNDCYKLRRKNPEVLEHIFMGGLLHKAITNTKQN